MKLSMVFILIAFFASGVVMSQTTFDYTGGMQTFTVPATGNYQLEVWGAQGGSSIGDGGYGGYAIGDIYLTAGQTLYVYVGETPTGATGGYNGGGNGILLDGYGAGGGGASDIRIGGTSLSNRIIVAGGGGGGSQGSGGSGGSTGGQGGSSNYGVPAQGGTQSAGGSGGKYDYGTCSTGAYAYSGVLGIGGAGIAGSGDCSHRGGSGGGGGYYGGGGMQISGGQEVLLTLVR